jgi:hypothetical protein
MSKSQLPAGSTLSYFSNHESHHDTPKGGKILPSKLKLTNPIPLPPVEPMTPSPKAVHVDTKELTAYTSKLSKTEKVVFNRIVGQDIARRWANIDRMTEILTKADIDSDYTITDLSEYLAGYGLDSDMTDDVLKDVIDAFHPDTFPGCTPFIVGVLSSAK